MPHTTEDPELGKNDYEYCDEVLPHFIQISGENDEVLWSDSRTGKLYKENPKKDPRDTLIEAQREYIELLGKCDSKTAGYLAAHNWHHSVDDLRLGKVLRNRIQAAEKAIKGGYDDRPTTI